MTENSEYLTFLNLIEKSKADIIQSLFKQKTVNKKFYLFAEEQICRQSSIVKNGIARKFYLHSDKEITTDIYLINNHGKYI